MKKVLLLILMWLYSLDAQANSLSVDTVTFNDANLKRCFDAHVIYNNWVQIKEVTELSCSEYNISTAEGVQQLTNLIRLDLSGNFLVEIHLSQNTKLQILDLTDNLLINIDITHNPALKALHLGANHLKKIDIDFNEYRHIRHVNLLENPLTDTTLEQLSTFPVESLLF